jgi:pilus assembly protein CpaC
MKAASMKTAGLASALTLILALTLALLAGAAFAADPIGLTVGQSRVVSAEGAIDRIVIDRPGVLSARLKSDREVELTAVGPGQAEVRLETRAGGAGEAYDVAVAPAADRDLDLLRDRLRGDPGLAGVALERRGDRVLATGAVKDLETHARLEALLQAHLGDRKVSDLVTVSGGQMVAVDVRFYAVAASTLKSLGFNFTDVGGAVQGGTFAPGTLGSFSLAGGALDVESGAPLKNAFSLLLARPGSGAMGVLSALSGAGLSQVLAHPTLLARSGESAEFLAGGDVPIPVPQGGVAAGAVTIEYRPYGVRLSVTPVVLSDKRIQLKLSPEVSELDYTNQITISGVGVPAFRRRSASTTVELGDGQSYVIAGLTYMTGDSRESRVPGLGDLPVIGALFKTSQTTRERQELIVVATPHLVSPLDKDPLEGAAIDPTQPNLGDRLLNRNTLAAPLQRFGLSP